MVRKGGGGGEKRRAKKQRAKSGSSRRNSGRSGKAFVTKKGALRIKSVAFEDAGVYTCLGKEDDTWGGGREAEKAMNVREDARTNGRAGLSLSLSAPNGFLRERDAT